MWIGIGIAVVLVLWIIVIFNRIVGLRNQVENSFAQIDVQLKRRADLIPNLIETVKGYVKHERETLESVTKARTQFLSAKTVEEKTRAGNQLQETLKSLFAVAENYPDLKANQNFLSLQEELSTTENKIAHSRQYYNDRVMEFNTLIQVFPNNVFAGMFNARRMEPLETPAEERKNVKVKF
ncbi:MAG: LemA family protein [Candidatus Woesearchaeota archaeon]